MKAFWILLWMACCGFGLYAQPITLMVNPTNFHSMNLTNWFASNLFGGLGVTINWSNHDGGVIGIIDAPGTGAVAGAGSIIGGTNLGGVGLYARTNNNLIEIKGLNTNDFETNDTIASISTNTIMARTEDNNPAIGDYIWGYSMTTGMIVKIQIGNLPISDSGILTEGGVSIDTE